MKCRSSEKMFDTVCYVVVGINISLYLLIILRMFDSATELYQVDGGRRFRAILYGGPNKQPPPQKTN